MHLQTRPCSACVHFHEAPPYVKVFSPQPITQIALSIVYLDIAYPSLLFNLRIRLASNADIINTLEFSMLVLTCVWPERKKKNCRGQLESRSLTKIYLPRAICITRSFSSWLSFNMVVRTGTKCSLSFGRHFRNCNMTFLRYSRFACSFSRSWFLSSLKKYIYDSRFSFAIKLCKQGGLYGKWRKRKWSWQFPSKCIITCPWLALP